jgi:signal transduction histidine kinase/CheY-like chemotaxis protein
LKKYLSVLLLLLLNFGYAQSETERKNIENQINEASRHFGNGEYEQALDLSKRALISAFKINDDELIAHAYNSIAVVYDEFSESKRAIEYYQKALLHANKTDNDLVKNWIYGNLGSAYYFNDIDVRKGIEYYKKSLEYAIKIKDVNQITYAKLNTASAYFSINDYKSGIGYVNEVSDYVTAKGQEEAKFTLNSLLGIYNSNTGHPEIAEAYFAKSVAIAEQNNMTNFLVNAYENLSEHYKKYNNPALEQQYRDKFNALSKILYSEEKKEALTHSAIQIELDEYKIQLERIELENDKQEQQLNESKLVSILFLIICVILLILIFTLYSTNIYRKKTNRELLEANTGLKRAMEKAEEASQLKTQFLSTITHELRTPLYGVVGITDMIADEHKELANSPHLTSLKFSAKYLLSLVNDILQMNKIEEKRIILENAPFNIHEEITTITNSVQYIAKNNHNELVVNIDGNIPKLLIGDKLRLSQIIMNLTSNALKFTKNGTVVVAVQLIKEINNFYYIEFKVSDNGVGIAAADQDKIFDMFVQVSRKDDDYQGTGLGLPIVKRLVELFGSTIHLESKLNEGTTFTFTIGFEAKELTEDELINNMEVIFTVQEDLKILVVEDNKINQMVTRKIMDKNGVKCEMVFDGISALKLLKTETYDIILMDINMPVINGFETSRRIRSMGIETPIIALTAFDKDEITDESNEAGINGIIIKPFDPAKLFQMIQSLLLKSKNAG